MKSPNQTKAYCLAGYKCKGKSATKEASKTLTLPHVKAYYDRIRDKATKRAQKNADDIIVELEKIGFSNMADYLIFSQKGIVLKESSKLKKDQMAAISEVTEVCTKKGRTRLNFKLYDKKAALELLGKRFKLFPNQHEVGGIEDSPIDINVTVKAEK